MTETIERYEHKGYTIEIVPDDDPMSPRDDDNLGTMVCFHRDYNLGDTGHDEVDTVKAAILRYRDERGVIGWPLLTRYLRIFYGATVVLPLALLDHSGITMRAGSSFAEDPGGWDTSQVGFIFDTKAGRDMTGVELSNVEHALRSEVESYATYLEGGYVGFVVRDHRGTVIESCWGFEDVANCKEAAEAEVPDAPDESVTDTEALDLIAEALAAPDWSPDTTMTIAGLVRRTGRKETA